MDWYPEWSSRELSAHLGRQENGQPYTDQQNLTFCHQSQDGIKDFYLEEAQNAALWSVTALHALLRVQANPNIQNGHSHSKIQSQRLRSQCHRIVWSLWTITIPSNQDSILLSKWATTSTFRNLIYIPPRQAVNRVAGGVRLFLIRTYESKVCRREAMCFWPVWGTIYKLVYPSIIPCWRLGKSERPIIALHFAQVHPDYMRPETPHIHVHGIFFLHTFAGTHVSSKEFVEYFDNACEIHRMDLLRSTIA